MTLSNRGLLHIVIGALAIAFFAFILLSVVSDGVSDDSDAYTITFQPGDRARLDLDGNTNSTNYYTITVNNNNDIVNIPWKTFTYNGKNYDYYNRDSKSFQYWSCTVGNSTKYYYYGDEPTFKEILGNKQAQNVTMTGYWTNSYGTNTIAFSPNGGYVNDSTSTNNWYKPSGSGGVSVPWKEFTANNKEYEYKYSGKTFMGWSLKKNTSEAEYGYGDTLPATTHSTGYIVYAVWGNNNQFVFDPNGGTVSQRYTLPGNTEGTIPWMKIGSISYEKAGSTFLGWSISKNPTSSDHIYVYGETIGAATNNTGYVLYAVWDNTNNVIIFDPNGGNVDNNTSGDPVNYRVSCDDYVYVPGNKIISELTPSTYNYTREGYTFLGWSIDRNAETPDYTKGYMLVDSETGYILYAVWRSNVFTITFNYDDTGIAQVEVDYAYAFDSSTYMNFHPDGKEDYKQVGWVTMKMTDQPTGDSYLIPQGAETYSRIIQLDSPQDLVLYPLWAYVKTDSYVELNDKNGCYYISGTTNTNGIVVNGGSPYIFIDNINLDFTNTTRNNKSPFIITGSQTHVTLTVMSDCKFLGKSNDPVNSGYYRYSLGYAGINVQTGTTLVISKDSLGKLTAQGGYARAEGLDGNNATANSVRLARPGAGIGANGATNYNSYGNNSQVLPYDDGCGSIEIYGGTISAYGGWGYYYHNNSGAVKITSGLVAAPGIGGTLDSGTKIKLKGGVITAATGHTNRINNTSVIQTGTSTVYKPIWGTSDSTSGSHGIIYINSIYAGNGQIDDNPTDATITRVDRTGGTTTAAVIARLQMNTNDNSSISSAQSVIIDNIHTVDMGGIAIAASGQSSTVLEIDGTLIHDGSIVALITVLGSYNTGTAELQSVVDNVSIYNIVFYEDTTTPHGKVYVYANETQVNGTESFGSINPWQTFTISGQSGSEYTTYTFTLELAEGYRLTGAKYKDGDNWPSVNFSQGGQSMVPNDGSIPEDRTWTATIRFSVSTTGGGPDNYVSFTIEKINVKAVIKNTYSEGELGSYPADIVKPFSTTSPSITWDEDSEHNILYTTGEQWVPYKESMTYLINISRGSGVNPFNVQWITANGKSVDFTFYKKDGVTGYKFTVDDIGQETEIIIRYCPTVKVVGLDPKVGSVYSQYIRVKIIDSDGNDGWLLDRDYPEGIGQYYAYVNKGATAYYKIYDERTDQQSFDPQYAWLEDGARWGVSRINVKTGTIVNNPNTEVNNVYSTGIIYDDTTIEALLSSVWYDLWFYSNDDNDYTSLDNETECYHVRIVENTKYNLPIKEQLRSVGIYDKLGYDLVGWHIIEYKNDFTDHTNWTVEDLMNNGEYKGTVDETPGNEAPQNSHKILEAIWNTDPHPYKVTYDNMGDPGDGSTGHPTSYTVEDRGVNSLIVYDDGKLYLVIDDRGEKLCTQRRGYTFDGWLWEGTVTKYICIEINYDTIGDMTFTACWTPIDVTLNLVDPNGHFTNLPSITVKFGSTYDNLPVYSAYTDYNSNPNVKYLFTGWELRTTTQSGTIHTKITNDTIVNNEQTHDIYIVWVDSRMYIVNLLIDGSEGGTASVNMYGTPVEDKIILTVTPYSGYEARKITISSATSPLQTYTYESGEKTREFEIKFTTLAGIYYYIVEVKFVESDIIRIEEPETTDYTYDGTIHYAIIVSDTDGFEIVSGNSATNSGDYDVTIVPKSGYAWMDGTTVEKEIPWKIYKRDAYIIALSISKQWDGVVWSPSNEFVTICIMEGDLTESSSMQIISSSYESITEVGTYPNRIIDIQNNINYKFTIIQGTFTIVKQDSSSITVELAEPGSITQSRASIYSSPSEPGRVVANIPAVGRKVD